MSGEEFDGQPAEQVQSEFFLLDLPNRESGRYYYRTSGLNAVPGTIVLFQYASTIIASAVFESNEKFDQPDGDYHGALLFDTKSIKVFDPIDAKTMRDVWAADFSRFGHVKVNLDPEKYPDFEERLSGIQTPPQTNAH